MKNMANEINGVSEKQVRYAQDLYNKTFNLLSELIEISADDIMKAATTEIAEFVMGKLNKDLTAERIIRFVKTYYDRYTIIDKTNKKIRKMGGHCFHSMR